MSSENKKTALLDSSSAIILFKADFHIQLTEMYDVVMPRSVYEEITTNFFPGAKEYRQLFADNKITLKEYRPTAVTVLDRPGLNRLDIGEHDVIQLYYAGLGNFVVTDDGSAARYCKREQIPFINALLVPIILGFAGIKDKVFCRKSFDQIIEIGRYSPDIITFAEKSTRDELSIFLP